MKRTESSLKKALSFIGMLFFLAFTALIAVLPVRLAKGMGRAIGRLLYHAWGSRRKVALTNIREARDRGSLPLSITPEQLILECFQNIGLSFVELVKIYYGLGGDILDKITFRGIENFDRVKASERGVILITAHSGNWELMALKCSRVLGRIGIVARALDNPYLNRILENSRARFGNAVIYKKGALKQLLRWLKNGEIVGILMDQAVLSDEGVIMDFLGRGAWTTKMPVLLAKRTGGALLPLFIKRTRTGHEVTIHPEVDIRGTEEQVLRRLNGVIEEHIKENPSEWLWFHRRWKRVPENPDIKHEPRAIA